MDKPTAFDLIVVGSGSAGLAAALAASAAGLDVLILEKSGKIGGTTAYSGAATWIPANHHAAAAGHPDSVEEAVTYLNAVAPDGWAATEGALWCSFAKNAPRVLQLLEERTPLRFELLDEADIYPDAPGGKRFGRMLSPRPLRRSLLGSWKRRLRTSRFPQVFTFAELDRWNPIYASWPTKLRLLPLVLWRLLRSESGMGAALVTGMLRGCLDGGCAIWHSTRALELVTSAGGNVTGLVAEREGERVEIDSAYGVILATGGFEWDRDRLEAHFPGPIDFVASPRTNAGDGHRMAEQVGAALVHMDQANISPAIPGIYEGGLQGIGWFHHRAPNAVVVDRSGQRFFNEEEPNLGMVLDERKEDGSPRHLPAWLISDAGFLSREVLALWIAKCAPSWMRRADGLGALATRIGVDGTALEATIDEFNRRIDEQRRDAFGRSRRRRIARKPYVAMPFNRSFMSTKGGPRTDEHARVLRRDGSVIGGLYCAGVAMANPIGTKAAGPGTTIGPNLTWGYIAGMHAAELASADRRANRASPSPGTIQ